jgi:transketolase
MTAQRDIFILDLLEIAKKDKNVVFISIDMGAPSLDVWRKELPAQFISAGISEQNAINVAAGLSRAGKKVYVYFMACWAARCFEQIRYSCAMANNPITLLGNGVGLAYAPAGPAHEPNEDIAYMRSINNIEIYSPANLAVTKELVKLTYNEPKLRYIRFERGHAKEMEESVYGITSPIAVVRPAQTVKFGVVPRIAIVSSGYMLGRAIGAWNALTNTHTVAVFDLWKIKPLDTATLKEVLGEFTHIVTIEEQSLAGGFGSAICEFVCDVKMQLKVLRIGLPERFMFENGSRDHLLDSNGLSVEHIVECITDFAKVV